MAYTALYRKWRPTCFEDVKGQEHIVKTLTNQISKDRIGHAYLFCGTRGTGKTTIAKIFARAVNCQHPVNGSPCNECPTCKAIMEGASMNVVEIDAASNNGVDNIREIRDEVKYSPTQGKYRVYIIDEVHMLSTGAFNALLKTLEEPPSYVIFILATTEAHKIPITVLSRCQRYDFKRMTNDILCSQIKKLLDAEGVTAEDAAISYVAKAADGSMRDALSLLEQCISFYYNQTLTYENVLDVLGAVDTEVFSQLLKCIIEKDVTGCIHLMDTIVSQGRDLGQFVIDFTWYMRNLLLLQTSEYEEDAFDVSADNLERLKQEAQLLDVDTLLRYIRIFSELSNQIRYAVSKRVLIEIGLIKLMKPAMERDIESLIKRIEALEEALQHPNTVVMISQDAQSTSMISQDAQPGQLDNAEKEREVIEISEAEYEDYQLLVTNWNDIIRSQNKLIARILQGTTLTYEQGHGLVIGFTDSWNYQLMKIQSRIDDFNQSLEQKYKKTFHITVKLFEDGKQAPKIISGNRIEGVEMEIGIETE